MTKFFVERLNSMKFEIFSPFIYNIEVNDFVINNRSVLITQYLNSDVLDFENLLPGLVSCFYE